MYGKERRLNRPRVTQEALNACDERRRLKAVIMRSEEDRERYKESNKRVRKLMKQAKNQWVNNQCKEIEECFSTNKTRRAYNIVKRLTKKPTKATNAINNKDGYKPKHEYCTELYGNKHTGDDRVLQISASAMIEPEPHILESEFLDAINSLPNNKAPGIDNIPGELLKSAKHEVIPVLTQICNKILRDRTWPREWTQSIIIPLPKKKAI